MVGRFWADIDVDLIGAILINFDLTQCTTLNAQFSQATFTGNADFNHTTFKGGVRFSDATFTGNADFENATFERHAGFSQATLPNTRYTETDDKSKEPWIDFNGARFLHDVPPQVERFVSRP